MLFPSCSRVLLFPCCVFSSPHDPNKVGLGPSCIWIRYIRASSWYFNEPFKSNAVETFKTNAFNAFALDKVIGPFGTCNGSLLVFLGWSTSSPLSSKGFVIESKPVSNKVRSITLKVTLTSYSPERSILYALSLILSKTWNGPSPRVCNFYFLWLGNCSLCMCTQTQSSGWKTTCLHPLFALEVSSLFFFFIFSRTPSWSYEHPTKKVKPKTTPLSLMISESIATQFSLIISD